MLFWFDKAFCFCCFCYRWFWPSHVRTYKLVTFITFCGLFPLFFFVLFLFVAASSKHVLIAVLTAVQNIYLICFLVIPYLLALLYFIFRRAANLEWNASSICFLWLPNMKDKNAAMGTNNVWKFARFVINSNKTHNNRNEKQFTNLRSL